MPKEQIRQRCVVALARTLRAARPYAAVDHKGYTDRIEDNLLPGISLADFEADFAEGAGDELREKVRAAHSSAALAINSFAPFRRRRLASLVGQTDLRLKGFEQKRPIGLPRARPPHLDAVFQGLSGVVALESKCLEYLTPKTFKSFDRYLNEIVDERRESSWYAEMDRIESDGTTYRYFDAAQLIKHALGLLHASEHRTVVLLYAYWEPIDAPLAPEFAEHRDEIRLFAERVSGDRIAFQAISYPELWSEWEGTSDPFLVAHVKALRSRYHAPALAWEGISYVDGRWTDEGLLDEDF